jgi:hypothetical protein
VSDTPAAPDDPAALLPLEAAREHLLHWWREPLAGALSLGIGCFDAWRFGRDAGLTASLDEALIVGGVILIAGTQRFIGRPINGKPQ